MCFSIPSGFVPTSVKLKDFCPVNKWEVDENGSPWFKYCPKEKLGTPKYILDQTTGRKYRNEYRSTIRIKCLVITASSPLTLTLLPVLNVAYRILKLVTLTHFWVKKEDEVKYDFKARLADAGKDLLRIVATPLVIVGMPLASIYGLIRPYDGRKLYATFERAIYGSALVAWCFQPRTKDARMMRFEAAEEFCKHLFRC